MATLQQYLGRFILTTAANDFTINSTAITLTPGYYYLHGYSGESTLNLIEHMQDLITDEAAPLDDFTVTYSATTGLITITDPTLGASNFTVTWTDSDLMTLLGFTGNLSGATTYTGTYPARYVFRPSMGLTGYPTKLSSWFAPRSTTRTVRANSGATASIKGDLLYDGMFAYQYLTDTEAYQDSSAEFNNFESFFKDCLHSGLSIRAYPDRTSITASTDFETCVIATDDEIGGFDAFATRSLQKRNGLWNVKLSFWKQV